MNVFQKTGVFVVRFSGTAMIALSVVGLVNSAILRPVGEYILSSLFWIIAGVFLVLVSKPLGRSMGDGLD